MTCRTQMFFARQGTITSEMHRVAERESLPVETIRDEVAIGRLIIPANVNHLKQRLDHLSSQLLNLNIKLDRILADGGEKKIAALKPRTKKKD